MSQLRNVVEVSIVSFDDRDAQAAVVIQMLACCTDLLSPHVSNAV